MVIRELKAAIAGLDDEMDIVIAAGVLDADGDETERHFVLESVEKRLDPDTGQDYAHCVASDPYGPAGP